MHVDKFRIGLDGSRIKQEDWDKIFKKKGQQNAKRDGNETDDGSKEKRDEQDKG